MSELVDESFYSVSADTADIFWKEFNQRINSIKAQIATVTSAEKLDVLKPCKSTMSLLQKCQSPLSYEKSGFDFDFCLAFALSLSLSLSPSHIYLFL